MVPSNTQTETLVLNGTSSRDFGVTAKQWLFIIVLVGAGLRFFAIWFGLPFADARPDEATAIGHAVSILGGDLNPHFFHWPSLTFYVFAACFSAASGIQRLLGFEPGLTVNEQYLIGRAVVAFAGTLTVVVVFWLGRRIAGDATALVASWFLAIVPLHVRDSHFAMADVLMTLFAMVSLALLLAAVDTAPHQAPRRGRVRGFAAAGLAAGLATSTKYSAATVIAAMAAAQGLSAFRATNVGGSWRLWQPPVAFLFAFACSFMMATPYALLDHESFAAGVTFDFTHLLEGHTAELGVGWIYHVKRSLPGGLSPLLFTAAILGILVMFRYHRSAAFILGAFCAVFYAVVGSGHTVFFRYILPLVPAACLSAAVAVTQAAAWLARRTRVSNGVMIGLLAALLGGPALLNSVWFDALLARTDTRVLAGRWLAASVKPEDSLYDAGGAYAEANPVGVHVHRWSVATFDPTSNSFTGADGRIPDWLVIPESPLRIYTTVAPGLRRLAGERYALVHLFQATRATREQNDPAVYDEQDAFFMPVSGFNEVLRPGPTLLIYRRVVNPKE